MWTRQGLFSTWYGVCRFQGSTKKKCIWQSDTTFEITSNPKYDGYQRGLALMVQKLFNKKSRDITTHTEARVISEDQKLPKALHKSITRKFQERKVYSSYWDKVWGVYLTEMQLISKQNKGVRFLLCIIGICSKYAWVVLLKDKNHNTITSVFQKFWKGLSVN